jgi:hypothetical protein
VDERMTVGLVLADPTFTNNTCKDRPSLDSVAYKLMKTVTPWIIKIKKELEPKEDNANG